MIPRELGIVMPVPEANRIIGSLTSELQYD